MKNGCLFKNPDNDRYKIIVKTKKNSPFDIILRCDGIKRLQILKIVN